MAGHDAQIHGALPNIARRISDLHSLWVKEDEMIESERIKYQVHLHRVLQLGRFCKYCKDPQYEGMGCDTREPRFLSVISFHYYSQSFGVS